MTNGGTQSMKLPLIPISTLSANTYLVAPLYCMGAKYRQRPELNRIATKVPKQNLTNSYKVIPSTYSFPSTKIDRHLTHRLNYCLAQPCQPLPGTVQVKVRLFCSDGS